MTMMKNEREEEDEEEKKIWNDNVHTMKCDINHKIIFIGDIVKYNDKKLWNEELVEIFVGVKVKAHLEMSRIFKGKTNGFYIIGT